MGRRIIIFIFKIVGILMALTLMGIAYWANLQVWVYDKNFTLGADVKAFIYYAIYYSRYLTWPQFSWNYAFFMGLPRVLDMTFLHFYLIQPLINSLGLWVAIKIYPMITYAILLIFSYFTFWKISKSQIVATAISLTVAISGSTYYSLINSGVFLSSISSMAFPITLFCLILYYQSRKRPYFYLGILSASFGIYSHGGNQVLFGLLPAILFLIFATYEGEKIITIRSIIDAFIFNVGVFFVGALGIWPQVASSLFQSSSYGSAFFNSLKPEPDTFNWIFKLTSPVVFIVLAISIIVFFMIYFIKKIGAPRITIPIFVIFLYYVLWNVASYLGLNPLVRFLFVFRTMWFLPIIAGVFSSALLARSNILIKSLVLLVVLGFLFVLIPGLVFKDIRPFINDFRLSTRQSLSYISDFVKTEDLNSFNHRLWTHNVGINNAWGVNYKMPLAEGSFHYYTKEAEPWQGWFYGTLNKINWDNGEIPHDMAKSQSLFFIDWYAVKYLVSNVESKSLDLADHFYENNDYVSKKSITEINSGKVGVFEISDSYTTPVIEPLKSPTVGFVGNDSGYEIFLKNIATLNLNTRFLVPIKYAKTIGNLCEDKINVDILIFYNYSEGFRSSCGWENVKKFMENGGKVWIETGGNSILGQSSNLPSIFPIKSNTYNSLGKDWNLTGQLAGNIDSLKLQPLVYKGDVWKISYSKPTEVKDGAEVLLLQRGNPIIVSQKVGNGEIIWSGLNLWYREEEFRENALEEVKPISLILSRLINLQSINVSAGISRSKPEKIIVSGKNFSGIVFKENYSSGWGAWVIDGDKRIKAKIFIAGPGLMYIQIPKDIQNGDFQVEIKYGGELIAKIAFWISLISTMILLDLIFGGHIINRLGFKKITERFNIANFSMKKWWNNDEEI